MAPIYYGSLKQGIVSYGSDTIGKGFYGEDQVYSSTTPPPIILVDYQYTEGETKSLFGLQNTISYYNGNSYSQKTFSQSGVYNTHQIETIPDFTAVPFINYTGGGIVPVVDTDHMTAQFQVNATISNIYGVQAGFAALARGQATTNPPFTESVWHLQINGENVDIPFRTILTPEQQILQQRYRIDGNLYAFCTVKLNFNSPTTVHFGNIDMYGNFSDHSFTTCLAEPIVKIPAATE